MYHIFLKYIQQNKLFLPQQKILLAVSGGLDSMVLTDLMLKAGFDFSVAHFNHTTRNGESDLDEEFVKDYCHDIGIDFYSTKIDIYALINAGKGNNFQDTARRYRYMWLEDIRCENKFDLIATAHHKDDNIETFIYKISSGSGLKGLQGVNIKKDKIIRPLLSFTRKQIKAYAITNNVKYREDSSNYSDKYSRNFIRHNIIPLFEKMFPDFEQRISTTMRNLKSADKALSFLIGKYFEDYIKIERDIIYIEKKIFKKSIDNKDIIYYFLSQYEYNASQIQSILKSLDNTGARFCSIDHQLLIDRENILIRKIPESEFTSLAVFPGNNKIEGIGEIRIEKIDVKEDVDFSIGLYLNGDKLNFPLILRRWHPGDRFRPFGLKGKSKKLKKYFTDKKLSIFDKEDVFVLLNEEEICMVIPYEISYDYRVLKTSKNVFKIDCEKQVIEK